MSLSNLLAIQRLQRFEASPQGVQRLLASLWLPPLHLCVLRQRCPVAGLLLPGPPIAMHTALAFLQSPGHNLRHRRNASRPQHPSNHRLSRNTLKRRIENNF